MDEALQGDAAHAGYTHVSARPETKQEETSIMYSTGDACLKCKTVRSKI